MAKVNAGRILIMPRGTYDANATYALLDLVLYNNASWLAKKTATGIEPAEGEYWHKMADGVELVTNLTTEVEGKALDASMGKVLKDLIDAVGADVLRERITNLETANTSQGEAIVDIEGDIDELRASIDALGNIDNATVRYVSDEADENFDWIQVQDAEGNWVNHEFVGLGTAWLYHNGTNHAEFGKYEGAISTYGNYSGTDDLIVTFGEDLVVATSGTSAGAMFSESVMSKAIDVTNYSKLKFSHRTVADASSEYNKVGIFLTQVLEGTMTATAEEVLLASGTSASGDVEIDISSLSGTYYVGICIKSNINNQGQITVTITDPYFE